MRTRAHVVKTGEARVPVLHWAFLMQNISVFAEVHTSTLINQLIVVS